MFASRYLLYVENTSLVDIYNIYAYNKTKRSVA